VHRNILDARLQCMCEHMCGYVHNAGMQVWCELVNRWQPFVRQVQGSWLRRRLEHSGMGEAAAWVLRPPACVLCAATTSTTPQTTPHLSQLCPQACSQLSQ
jgi:hypothetical protein